MHVPAERRADDETSGQVAVAPEEERGVRVAIGREIGGDPREHARVERRIDDVAFMVGEQQLAGEPARQPPDRRLFGKPSEEPCGGTVSDRQVCQHLPWARPPSKGSR